MKRLLVTALAIYFLYRIFSEEMFWERLLNAVEEFTRTLNEI